MTLPKTLKGILCGVIAVTLLAAPGAVSAQTPGAPGSATLAVSPPTIEAAGAPGSTITQKVALTNASDIPRTISVQPQNFTARGEAGEAELCTQDCPFPLAPWITVTPSTITIPAGLRQEFDVVVRVPQGAEPGGHYGALVFSPAVGDEPGANVRVVSQVTTLMLIRVPGEVREQAAIASFDTDKSRYSSGPVQFDLRIRNDGNVHVKPSGSIDVFNVFGRKIATVPVQGQNVLPGSVRNLSTKWDHSTLFGPYRAEASLIYGDTQQTLQSSTRFWGAPLTLLLIILGVLIALFVLVWLPRKRIRKAFKALASSD